MLQTKRGSGSSRRLGGKGAALIVMACSALACSTPTSTSTDFEAAEGGAFFSPQGIAATDRWILVTNTAFGYRSGAPVWGAGSVTFIDRRSTEVVGRVLTTQPNPQEIAIGGGRAVVLNGGTTAIGTDGLVRVTGPGGIDLIDLTPAVPTVVSANIPLPVVPEQDPRIGAFGRSLALVDDGKRAIFGSGTRGDLFEVDLEGGRVIHGAQNPIELFDTPPRLNGLTVVRPTSRQAGDHNDPLMIANYNTDELCLSDGLNGALTGLRCGRAGVHSDLIEGPIDLASGRAGDLLVLMTLANALYRVEVGHSPFTVDADFAPTGLGSNRVVVWEDHAYVINSLSNNMQRVRLSGEDNELPFAVFPVGSNPFDLVVTEEAEEDRAWVTLFGTHQVAVVSLETGSIIDLLGGPMADAPARDGAGEDKDQGVDDDECGWQLEEIVAIGEVVDLSFGSGAGHGQQDLPAAIQGAPDGSGSGSARGGSRLLSLGDGGQITVGFGRQEIVDGPGADFVIYENPFLVSEGRPYAEPAVVAVAAGDGLESGFVEFPCKPEDETPAQAGATWPHPGCAGVRPVHAIHGQNCLDPRDPVAAGGDPFDLADLGLRSARYVRIRDAGRSVLGTTTRGFDLDAIVLIHHAPR